MSTTRLYTSKKNQTGIVQSIVLNKPMHSYYVEGTNVVGYAHFIFILSPEYPLYIHEITWMYTYKSLPLSHIHVSESISLSLYIYTHTHRLCIYIHTHTHERGRDQWHRHICTCKMWSKPIIHLEPFLHMGHLRPPSRWDKAFHLFLLCIGNLHLLGLSLTFGSRCKTSSCGRRCS